MAVPAVLADPPSALRRPSRPALAAALLLGAVLLALTVLRPLQPGAGDPVRRLGAAQETQPVLLRGELLEDPRPLAPAAPGAEAGDAGCRALLQLADGRTELLLPRCRDLRQGWTVRVSGLLRRPRPAPHPLLAGSAERLARQGAWTRLRVERLEVLARPATPVADLRRRIAERFVAVAGAARGGVLAALVLGSAVVPLPADLREAFRASGLSHALAASGFHLTVLLGAVRVIARPFGAPLRLALAAGAILLFLLLAGPQPSVVRAVLMGAVALLLLESGLRSRPLGLLGLSVAVMLLLQPHWWADVGFQLSVAATAGLVVSAEPLERRLGGWLPRRAGWLAGGLAVPLAATLWTLPLQLLHFGVLPLYAVPANVVAAPLLTPLTLGAMALALVAPLLPPALVPALLAPLAWPLQAATGLLVAVAEGFAALPMAQWRTGRPEALLVALLTLALLAWLIPGVARRWRGWALALCTLVVGLHLGRLGADQLLLVHQGGRDLLLARHQGRAALVSRAADVLACRQAQQLALGLGIERYDWVLLLDPVAAPDPACWRRQSGLLLAAGEAGPPLRAGQRVVAAGLSAEALAMDSQALQLHAGRHRWLLLPDRQSLWAWQASGRPLPPALWLGFAPRPRERAALQAAGARRVWLSGPAPRQRLPEGWRASGVSGWLADPPA